MGDYQKWKQTFSEIVSEIVSDKWTINICNEKPNQERWKSFTQRDAFGEYDCPNCRNHWKSTHAVIEFYIQRTGWQGNVMMNPLGQKCKNCIHLYIKPEMPNRIITIIVQNLIKTIRKEYYGEYVPQLEPANDGQSGHGPHIKKLCEACQLGKCKRETEIDHERVPPDIDAESEGPWKIVLPDKSDDADELTSQGDALTTQNAVKETERVLLNTKLFHLPA
ncbi:hypothetical protein XELAEV_18027465mg [Xenopus laevis]|uniref:3CxxC-type domain-containing protein n=1 Tax=Xenopus laevis TaxID=8355 RepID=A0A974CXP6_XENLA|nr:hypothetical protein XELAEV_18027465mg [Xenopus laevis]